jgi:polyhydroxybutyrate depolymerase
MPIPARITPHPAPHFPLKFALSLGATIFLMLLSLAPMRAQESQEKIDVGDISRAYVVHLPQGYDAHQHYPLVILLHSQNQDTDDLSRLTHFSQFAEKNGIIVVYPSASRGRWNVGVRPEQADFAPRRGYGRRGGFGYPGSGYPGGGGGYPGGGQGGGQNPGGQNPDENRNRQEPADDVAFLNQLLDQIALKYSIDRQRIYAAGLGDGGFMAERAACSMADRVAAIAVVSASFPKAMICLPSRPVPALFIDGTYDPIVPYDGGMYKPGRFHVLSAEESAKTWAKFDRCDEKPIQAKIPPVDGDKGGKETKTFTFNGCRDNAQVVLYAVKNGGHTWPGGEQYTSEKEVGKTSHSLNANEVVWGFFSTRKLADANSGQGTHAKSSGTEK